MGMAVPNEFMEPGELINIGAKPLRTTVKPRIRFIRGWWRCGLPKADVSLCWSWGKTPQEAWSRWRTGEIV